MDPGDVRFIADFMLGRLCRWLRLLGFDTEYAREEDNITYRSLKESRVILTRSRKVSRGKSYDMIFIQSDDFREQLRQVMTSLGLKIKEACIFSRCVYCNMPVKRLPKESVRTSVPLYVYENSEEFSSCPRCRRVYWKGSHAPLLKKHLGEISA